MDFKEFEKEIVHSEILKRGKGLWQNEFHKYDVFTHTMVCVHHIKELTSDTNLIAAAYLHDIGKPLVRIPRIRNGQLRWSPKGELYHEFPDHEYIGKNMVYLMDPEIFRRYNLDQEKIAELVGAHYLPLRGIKSMRRTKSFREFIDEYYELANILESIPHTNIQEIMTLFVADTLAKDPGIPDKDELMLLYRIILNSYEEWLPELYEILKK